MGTNTAVQKKNEIVVYQPNETMRLDVLVEDESVWLNQVQMAELFGCTVRNVRLHLANIYKTGEQDEGATRKDFFLVRSEGGRQVSRTVSHYNLEAIISVGFRVNSIRGAQFRRWATSILKDYLLNGYSVNAHINQLEDKMDRRLAEHDQQIIELKDRVDFFVRTELPPKEGVLFKGQIKDGYDLVVRLIRSAKKSVALIDNWIDERVLTMMEARGENVDCTIYTKYYSKKLKLDVENHNRQYRPISVKAYRGAHDRFLLIDNTTFHIGASLKDLGTALTAFTQMEVPANVILEHVMGR